MKHNFYYIFGIFLTIFIISSVLTPDLFLVPSFAQADTDFLIASWNLKNFGNSRSQSDLNLEVMSKILTGSKYNVTNNRDFDIIFVQEIQSKGIAFHKLCDNYMKKMNYDCDTTNTQFPQNANNEDYGVFWKKYLNVRTESTSSPTSEPYISQGKSNDEQQMIRPPMKATVTIWPDFEIFVYNNHIKPSERSGGNQTFAELDILQKKITDHHNSSDYVIVLGDLNASCDYLNGGIENYDALFVDDFWLNIFPDAHRTNFADRPCGYDQIILSDSLSTYFFNVFGSIDYRPDTNSSFGAPSYKVDGKHISDHHLVWASLDFSDIVITDIEAIDYSAETYVAEAVLVGAIWYFVFRRH